MKKFNFLAVVIICTLVVSCKKEGAVAPDQKAAAQQADTTKTTFDESNSTTVDWSQLPAELRNAIPVSTEADVANARVSGTQFSNYIYAVGPWGGGGGSPFSIAPPNGSRIYAIAIRAGAYIDRFTVWYVTANGTIYMGADRGGSGGSYYLQYFSADEYIYYASGRSGAYLDHLNIYTNRKSFGYGGDGGSPFAVGVAAGNQILGFYGRSGSYVDQIGFHVYSR